jgi:hypothetical protein
MAEAIVQGPAVQERPIVQGPVVQERRIVPVAVPVPETLAGRIVRAGPVAERGREILVAPIDQAAEPELETSVAQIDPAVGPEPQLDRLAEVRSAVAAEIALAIGASHRVVDLGRATVHLEAEVEAPRDPLVLAEEAVWAAVDLAAVAVVASEAAGAAAVVVAAAVEAEVVVNNQCPRKNT